MQAPTRDPRGPQFVIELREMPLPARVMLAIAVLRGGMVHITRARGCWLASA